MTRHRILENYMNALVEIGVGYSYPGETEDIERKFIAPLIACLNEPIIFDVGANEGGYLRMIKELSPKSKIFAFEPNPIVFKTLKTNESLGDIQTFSVAVGERDETTTFYDIENEATPFGSLHKDVIEKLHKKTSREFDVQVRSIDSLMAELGIAKISLLKVDTEGHELAVFKGASAAIAADKIDMIQFEFNNMNVISRTFFKDFYDFLGAYRLFRLSRNGLLELDDYIPLICELFGLQTIFGVRRNLT